uniref:Uncharacterized protein n=1 Tax=Salmonella sp. TaxID=599 RepID=A0A482ETK9_SALSP|nr:hypothetical protein NNIBIDOC_00221 [Salmonella sp.]
MMVSMGDASSRLSGSNRCYGWAFGDYTLAEGQKLWNRLEISLNMESLEFKTDSIITGGSGMELQKKLEIVLSIMLHTMNKWYGAVIIANSSRMLFMELHG